MYTFKEVMEVFGYIANIIAVVGIPYSVYQIIGARKEYKENLEKQKVEEKRKNDLIEICMREIGGHKKIILPGKIRRTQLTRQEIMGRIGAIPKKSPKGKATKQDRFKIEYTNTRDFLDQVDNCYVSRETELCVNCKTEEINQFDNNKMKQLEFTLAGFNNENP